MAHLTWVLIAGYIIGALPVDRWIQLILNSGFSASPDSVSAEDLPAPPVISRIAAEVIQALLALWISSILGWGRLGLVVAGMGTVGGNVWPFRRDPAMSWTQAHHLRGTIAMATVLMFMSPQLFLVGLAIWSAVFIFLRSPVTATIVASFAVPVATLYFRLPDLQLVYTIVAAGLVGYRHLTRRLWPGLKLTRTLRRVIYLALVLSILILAFANRYVYRGFGPAQDIFRSGPSSLPVVALTFDDGPDARFTPLVLDVLKEYDVRATFYLVGRQVERNPDIARRIVAEGHEVGNHSYSHRNMWRMSPDLVRSEVERAQAEIASATGRSAFTFRPPRGLYNQALLYVLAEHKQPMVLWSLSSQDWAEVSARAVATRVLSGAGNGEIILFHDGGDLFGDEGGDRMNTVEALPTIIEELKARGYYFVTVTEMMVLSGLLDEELEPVVGR